MQKLNFSLLQKIIILTMLIEVQFFYIFPLPNIFWFGNNSDNKSYILFILYFAMSIMFINCRGKLQIGKMYRFIASYMLLQVSIAFLIVVRNKIMYSQSWFDMLMCADYLMFPITAIVFMIAMKKEEDYQKMLYVIFCIIFLCQIVIFIQGTVYKFTSIILFKGMTSSGIPRIRGGMIRSTWATLNFIAYDYALYSYLEKNNQLATKKQASRMLVLALINLILFCGTRAIMVATAISLVMMYISSSNVKTSRKIMIVIFFAVVLFGFGLYDKIINSFSLDGEYAGSTSVRLHELDYYISGIKKNPLFGIGLVRPKRADLKLVYGGTLGGTPTDVGVIGLLAEVGLLGAFCFAVLLLRGIYIIFKIKKDKNRIFLVGLITYIISTLPTLIITNVGKIYALPVCIAIFEGVYYRYNVDKSKQLQKTEI
jgi:hypothetical protein